MAFLLEKGNFHCYVRLLECIHLSSILPTVIGGGSQGQQENPQLLRFIQFFQLLQLRRRNR